VVRKEANIKDARAEEARKDVESWLREIGVLK